MTSLDYRKIFGIGEFAGTWPSVAEIICMVVANDEKRKLGVIATAFMASDDLSDKEIGEFLSSQEVPPQISKYLNLPRQKRGPKGPRDSNMTVFVKAKANLAARGVVDPSIAKIAEEVLEVRGTQLGNLESAIKLVARCQAHAAASTPEINWENMWLALTPMPRVYSIAQPCALEIHDAEDTDRG